MDTKSYCIKRKIFLPKKVENIHDKSEDRIYDATESKIDRPQKKQKNTTRGRKRCIL